MNEAAPPIPLQPTLLERFFVRGPPALWARWVFLRALGGVFFSAFLSLVWTIHGLIGPRGISPAQDLLADVAARMGPVERVWALPSFLWLGAGDGALTALVAIGLVASTLLVFNVAPRGSIAVAGLAFLSFVSAAQEFSMYQSDGMLLEAAFLSLFFAPPGLRPGLGAAHPPSSAALFMLRWEWFRIYFESGVVKIASGDPQWASLTAMDHYYETGPLPTWVAWYAHQLPHAVHAASCVVMFVVELGVVWLAWMGRRARRVCWAIVTPFQVGIILTANYAFLNYIVLFLGFLLLDDRQFVWLGLPDPHPPAPSPTGEGERPSPLVTRVRRARWRTWGSAFALSWAFYVTVFSFLRVPRDNPLSIPITAIEPARIANAYGLFAVMTPGRYELELQATADGVTWVPYRFRFKPQDVREAPAIFAPYQPRFEWNLWFASLARSADPWVVDVELRLMQREPSVLALFRDDPLGGAMPQRVRTVKYEREPDGTIGVVRTPRPGV
jgi:hypothetical protein